MIDTKAPVTQLLNLVAEKSAWRDSEDSIVLLLDWRLDELDTAEPFGGLLEAQSFLQRGLRPAILMLGLPELTWVREMAPQILPPGSEAWGILEWPGFVYLRYAQLPERLNLAYETAISGASAPVPEKVIRDRGLLLRALSDLRHLLIENRKKSLSARQADFAKAIDSGKMVSRYHLAPSPAFDAAGRHKLARLWDLDDIARASSPATGGLNRLKEALDEFEQRWDRLEEAKAQIEAAETNNNEPERMSSLAHAQEQIGLIGSSLSLVGKEIDALRNALQEIDNP